MHDPSPTQVDDEAELSRLRARIAELGFLAEAGALLSSSLDYEATLAKVARLAVPHIADWCAVDILDSGGALRRLAVVHTDPSKVALAHELHRRYPFDPEAEGGVAAVLRTGRSELVPAITDELVRASVEDPELREVMLGLGLRSAMTVPLIARGRPFGTITLVAAESGRRFDETSLAFAEELARRAAVAVDNARLYQELLQFKTTLDQIIDCVFTFDPQTLRFTYVNQGAIEQVGYGRDELLRMTPLDIKPEFSETGFRAMIAPLLAGELSSHTFETVHRHKHGHDVPVEIVLQYVAAGDDSARFVAVVRDITERRAAEEALRASEQRYRDLADAMPLVVWTAKADGSVDYFNRRWYEYTGQRIEDSLDWGWRAALHPEDVERCAERWEWSIRTSQPYEIEYRWRRAADATYRWHLGRAVPVRDRRGTITHWVGTGTDIDDQKRSEEILRERSEEMSRLAAALRDRNRELDQFAYITSHDLKAPLRGISNLAQWVEEDLGEQATPEIRQHLALLRGRVQRMEGLIEGILQYSRVGRAGGNPEPVDVGRLLEEAIDLLAPGPHVSIAVAPGMPTVYAERLPLLQVFSNLIGNAIKHHRGTEVRISVSARDGGDCHMFAVADDGPGIAPQYHERIFGIFQTLLSRDKVEGSGLGLALVKKIVERAGGQVWVESEEGAGATFYVAWPKRAQRT